MHRSGGPRLPKTAMVARVPVLPWLHNAEIVKLIYGGAEGVNDKIKKSETDKKESAENGK